MMILDVPVCSFLERLAASEIIHFMLRDRSLDEARVEMGGDNAPLDIFRACMSLRIQRRSWTNGDGTKTQTWRLVIEDYKGKSRTCYYPSKSEYLNYGFDPSDTEEAAKLKLKVIQAQRKLARDAERRTKIDHRLRREDLIEGAFLPKFLWPQFLEFLKGRRAWDEVPDKVLSHLRVVRRLVRDLCMDPVEWPVQAGAIYNWFIKKNFSMSYVEKVLPLVNEYGYFYCKHFKKSFLPVPPPPARIIEKINDSNSDARDGKTNESLPLKAEHLNQLQTFAPEKLRWVRASLFFGLRPTEVDSLTPEQHGKRWRIEMDGQGTPVLVIYQPKLVRVPRDRRWKRIPCILPEQQELAKELLQGAPIARPYAKYIRKHLGDGYTLYAGRKGFEPMMRAYGQNDFNIHRWQGKRDFREFDEMLREPGNHPGNPKNVSEWMGHKTLTRTQGAYTDKVAVEYDPLPSLPPRPERAILKRALNRRDQSKPVPASGRS